MMPTDGDGRVRIISPRFEYAENDSTVSVLVFCQMCDQQIVGRTYSKLKESEKPTDEQLAQRHADSREDGIIFCEHLEIVHPDGVDIRLFRQAS